MVKHWRPWERENSDPSRTCSQNAPAAFANRNSANPDIRCNCCGIVFKRESELKRHKTSVHVRKLEPCQICGKEFTRKDNLTRHLKLAHSRESKPRCKYCLKSLSRKDAVQRHETTCSKNYGKPGDVSKLSHLQRLNMKLEKSKCNSGENPNKVDQTKTEF